MIGNHCRIANNNYRKKTKLVNKQKDTEKGEL